MKSIKNWIIVILTGALALSVVTGVVAQPRGGVTVELLVWQDTANPEQHYVTTRLAGGSWPPHGAHPIPVAPLEPQDLLSVDSPLMGAGATASTPSSSRCWLRAHPASLCRTPPKTLGWWRTASPPLLPGLELRAAYYEPEPESFIRFTLASETLYHGILDVAGGRPSRWSTEQVLDRIQESMWYDHTATER